MTTERDSSFDERWRREILRADLDELRKRLDDLAVWAHKRLDLTDRALAGSDLGNPTSADLVHLTERTTLVTVLSTLAGDEGDDE